MAAVWWKTHSRNISRFPGVFYHSFSSKTTSKQSPEDVKYCRLEKRGLLRVGGADSVKFLQGLVTNHIELFHQDTTLKSMFSMFLNAQGRVLYDAIFYKDQRQSGNPSFLIECDKNATQSLAKHLKMYKLRSKVDISNVEDISPWAIFSTDDVKLTPKTDSSVTYNIVTDPRIKALGFHLLLPGGIDPPACLEGVAEGEEGAYEEHRAMLGICEGTEEIPTGSALPLEYNLSFLHGVSFQKGCYVGQELTARTHHTGVIRKRIMPFTMEPHSAKLEPGAPIKTAAGKSSGKLCIIHGQYGLAMIRLANLKAGKQFIVDAEGNNVEINPYIPKWWPKDEQNLYV